MPNTTNEAVSCENKRTLTRKTRAVVRLNSRGIRVGVNLEYSKNTFHDAAYGHSSKDKG